MAKLTRITMHWAVTGYKATKHCLQYYHGVTEGDGTEVMGRLPPKSNQTTKTDYIAHARGFNTSNIGKCMAAMAGAKYHPFDPGKFPMTRHQVIHFCFNVAKTAKRYGILVTRETVFSHAEIEERFGKKQKGKWDIRWLPGLTKTYPAEVIGDILRKLVQLQLDEMGNSNAFKLANELYDFEIENLCNPKPAKPPKSAGVFFKICAAILVAFKKGSQNEKT